MIPVALRVLKVSDTLKMNWKGKGPPKRARPVLIT
ncbi:hypothetical protein HRED_07911 [Candidatus Haloredivivus sp. G17]|nr:hypothetical protein HRED_07911 [Candidatus Haloredivivus sp. G17]